LTVSRRSLEAGGVEVKLRHSPERTVIPWPEILSHVADTIETLQAKVTDQAAIAPHNA
jgi:hypothetical protein